jgi:hypothetical protein
MNIGEDIMAWMNEPKYDDSPEPLVLNVTLTKFAVGSTVSYTDPSGTAISKVVTSEGTNFTIVAETEQDIRSSLDTLTVQAPLNSDDDFVIEYFVGTASGYIHTYTHPIRVMAVADPPQVSATQLLNMEEGSGPLLLDITATKSADVDDSETLSIQVRFFCRVGILLLYHQAQSIHLITCFDPIFIFRSRY